MQKIHVLVSKELVDPNRLQGKIVIVLDVMFATTSIVASLAHGAADVIPVMSRDAALKEASGRPACSYVLSGELNTQTLTDFVDPYPLTLIDQRLTGRTLIYSTTNGTVALCNVRGAECVYVSALVNGGSVVDYIACHHKDAVAVLVVCSGSDGNFNLEDFYGAGYLVSLFARRREGYRFTDAAQAAQMLHEGTDAMSCFRRARVGRMMLERGLDRELEFAAQKSVYSVVPRLTGTTVRIG